MSTKNSRGLQGCKSTHMKKPCLLSQGRYQKPPSLLWWIEEGRKLYQREWLLGKATYLGRPCKVLGLSAHMPMISACQVSYWKSFRGRAGRCSGPSHPDQELPGLRIALERVWCCRWCKRDETPRQSLGISQATIFSRTFASESPAPQLVFASHSDFEVSRSRTSLVPAVFAHLHL